jgi:organic hydroperoxide reductase OsmC/OhrA
MRTIYTAEATVTGGRLNGRGRTPDGRLELALRMPAAHELCPYSKATRGNIELGLTVNGMPVG